MASSGNDVQPPPLGELASTIRPNARATVVARPEGAHAVSIRVKRICDEMSAIGLDEVGLAFWAQMRPSQIRAILASGTTSKQGLRRLRRGMRLAYMDRAAGERSDVDLLAWKRLTLKYLLADGDAA